MDINNKDLHHYLFSDNGGIGIFGSLSEDSMNINSNGG